MTEKEKFREVDNQWYQNFQSQKEEILKTFSSDILSGKIENFINQSIDFYCQITRVFKLDDFNLLYKSKYKLFNFIKSELLTINSELTAECIDLNLETEWQKIENVDKKEIPKSIIIKNFITDELNLKFRRNTISHAVTVSKYNKPYVELDDIKMKEIMNSIIDADLKERNENYIFTLICGLAENYNPIDEFVKSWPDVKGTGYIQQLADTIKMKDEDTEFWHKAFRKWLIAYTVQIKGKKPNHSVLLFTGAQGLGKTTWFNKLMPNKELLYVKCLDPSNKDDLLNIHNRLLINLDDISVSSKWDWEKLKTLTTLESFQGRLPYERNPINLQRHASFVGSLNDHQFLSDQTGNRRFLIFEPIAIDYNYDPEILLNALSEAWAAYESGEKYWFDGDEINEINSRNENFSQVSAEEELLFQKFYIPEKNDPYARWYTNTEIFQKICDSFNTRLSQRKLGLILKKFNIQVRSHKYYLGFFYNEDQRRIVEEKIEMNVSIN